VVPGGLDPVTVGPAVARTLLLFFLSEGALSIVKRARWSSKATSADRGTRLMLVVVITLAITAAVMLSGVAAGRLPWPPARVGTVAMVLLVAGLAIRWWAILTLGRFFTVDVAIHHDHTLVDHGPYRFVRHPSYTGLLLCFAGFGLAFGNALSLLAVLVPIGAALLRRIRVEESALGAALGSAYETYCATTKRLIPGVY
jgi:protein-S-isoprenylcysteine O-methyltransferase